MTDLDFDEIDKAVTSALEGASDNGPAPDVAATNDSLPMEVPEGLPAVIVKPQPPAIRRTTGRIMDITPRSKSVSGNPKAAPRPSADSYHAPSSALRPAAADELVDEAPTPFLPDANEKIEKRPLGKPADVFVAPLVEEAAEVPELGSADEPLGTEAPLPAELSEDVINLEASSETPVPPLVAGETVDDKPEFHDVPVPEVVPSIVQQYQEKQSTTGGEPGAIYDTEAYHMPLKDTTKRQRPILIVLWIVGLIIIGAGIGWALYSFVLPLL